MRLHKGNLYLIKGPSLINGERWWIGEFRGIRKFRRINVLKQKFLIIIRGQPSNSNDYLFLSYPLRPGWAVTRIEKKDLPLYIHGYPTQTFDKICRNLPTVRALNKIK